MSNIVCEFIVSRWLVLNRTSSQVMELHVEFIATDARIVLSTRVGAAGVSLNLPLLIESFSFVGKVTLFLSYTGTMRSVKKIILQVRAEVSLKPHPPFLDVAKVSLLEAPDIDFGIRPLKSVDIMDVCVEVFAPFV